jgi:hypothetical protein
MDSEGERLINHIFHGMNKIRINIFLAQQAQKRVSIGSLFIL